MSFLDYFILGCVLTLVSWETLLRWRQRAEGVTRSFSWGIFLIRGLFAGLVIVGGLTHFLLPPAVAEVYPTPASTVSSSLESVTIGFDRPVRAGQLSVEVTPEVQLACSSRGLIGVASREVSCRFKESLTPNRSYRIRVEGVEGLVGSGESYQFTFETLPPPDVTKILPPEDSEGVSLDEVVKVYLTLDDRQTTRWRFSFSPELDFDTRWLAEEQAYAITPLNKFKQGKTYQFKVYRRAVVYERDSGEVVHEYPEEEVGKVTFQTIRPPWIEKSQPQGEGILSDRPLRVRFSKEMVAAAVEAKVKIEPPTGGTFSWTDNREVTFLPTEWQKDQLYRVTVPAGVPDQEGGFLLQDHVFQFRTLGPVKVTRLFPAEGQGGVDIDTYISVHFDQDVDKPSARNKFSLSPSVAGRFIWKSDRSMTFIPEEDLAYNTRYEIVIGSGVASIHGLASEEEFTSSFNTRRYLVRLSVPMIHQQHSHTCNLAAARMALAYRGVSLSENQLLQKIGVDLTPNQRCTEGVWGNPNQAYVGSIDGGTVNSCTNGYGVHWGPVARVIGEYRKVEVKRGWDLPSLLTRVESGNPVILWWQNGWTSPDPISWTTPGGEKIEGVQGMHSEVVIGFVGSKQDPDEIIVNDPWRGVRHYNQGYFFKQWAYYNNTAVVVY